MSMTTKTTAKTLYTVFITTRVDHPELRDSSYAIHSGPAYTHTAQVECKTHSGAVALIAELLSGSDDFSSEYVRRIAFRAIDANGKIRWPRRSLERLERDGAWIVV